MHATSGVAPGGEDVAGLVDGTLPPLLDALHASGVAFHEPGVLWCENQPGTDDLRVRVPWPAGDGPQENPVWEVVALPATERDRAVLPR